MGSNSQPLVFLTGATGFIGYRTLLAALQKGYQLRVSVRKEAQIEKLKAPKAIQPYLAQLEFVVVPDITVDGAFDEALKGITHVLHIASPLAQPFEDYEKEILDPARKGTLTIMKSAKKTPSVKRLVITSSIVSIMSFVELVATDEKVHSDNQTTPDEYPPFELSRDMQAYSASKVAAHNAIDKFMAEEKPQFDVIRILPGFVIGHNDLLTTRAELLAAGTARYALLAAIGQKTPGPLPGSTVHVDDVALAHVLALDDKVEGGQNFLTASGSPKGTVWQDQIDIISKAFPEQVKAGVFPLGGEVPSKPLRVDATRTEKVLGFTFKSYEEQVKAVAGQYAELKA